ncbi:hypothetical protein ACHHYP_04360 [Achlya hypogyna]|uniref:glucan endo-1,3-beta-D-glucosidase n=1 Tax=Achlya hypogyna TaxID=1202772 RepID=A0A1V9Z1A3_ACHHY|nr:hypothetical protein ACHHYP_04360 [Achlya hypogyna]
MLRYIVAGVLCAARLAAATPVWGIGYNFPANVSQIHTDLKQIQAASFTSIRTNDVLIETPQGLLNTIVLAAEHNLTISVALPIHDASAFARALKEVIFGASLAPTGLRSVYLGQYPPLHSLRPDWLTFLETARTSLRQAQLGRVPVGLLQTDTALLAHAPVVATCDLVGAVVQPCFNLPSAASVSDGISSLQRRLDALSNAFGDKVDVAATGWPTTERFTVHAPFGVVAAAQYFAAVRARNEPVFYEAFRDNSSFDFSLTRDGKWKFDVRLPVQITTKPPVPATTAGSNSTTEQSGNCSVLVVCLTLLAILSIYANLVMITAFQKPNTTHHFFTVQTE